MMAQWDLASLDRDLPGLSTPLLLLVGGRDRTLPPSEAKRVQVSLPAAELAELPGLGHLAHEEQPETVAQRIVEFAARCDVRAGARRTSIPGA